MNVVRVGALGWGIGFVVAAEAFAGHALAQGAPSGSAKPPTSAPGAAAPVFKAQPPAASAKPTPAAPAPTPAAKPPAPAPTPTPAAKPPAPASTPAPAASAPAPSAPVVVSAPDVVRLKNGGILRGTISELVPGDYVSIVLITGEARKVPYADVQYAGANDSANSAPAAPAPAVGVAPAVVVGAGEPPKTSSKPAETQPFAVVHAQESRVNVSSKQDGVTLFRRSVSAGFSGVGTVNGYDEVCTVPCNVSMPAGTHTFAVAKPGGKPREADPVQLPAGNANMAISYVDRTAIRVGMGLLGLGLAIGGFAMVISDSGDSSGSSNIAGPLVLAGLGGGLFGLAFALPDGSKVTVTQGAGSPNNNPVNGGHRWLDQRARDVGALRNGLSGLTITAHF